MNFTDILSLILSSLSSLGLTLGGIWFYRENKRMRSAEATHAEMNNAILAGNEWKNIAAHREETLKIKDEKIDHLYLELGGWREKYNDLLMQHSELGIQNAMQHSRVCNVKCCPNREPQSGY